MIRSVDTIRARTPLRIDLAGGTLDIWPLHLLFAEPAVTVNAALDLPCTATVEHAPDGGIHLASRDLEREVAYPDLAALEADLQAGTCPLALLAESVRAVAPAAGLALTTTAESPAGAGLGGSSALLCATIGALIEAESRSLEPLALRALAQDVETRVLGKPTGYQDYFPPILGGCLALEGAPGGIVAERLEVDLDALGRRLRLAYTGLPHASGLTNWGVVRAFLEGEPRTVDALHELAGIARDVRAHLRAGRMDAALGGVIADGGVRRRMAPGVSTPEIEALDQAVRSAGAVGTKPMGAGGGGCVLIVLGDEAAGPAVDTVLEAGPWRPVPLRLVAEGLVFQRPQA